MGISKILRSSLHWGDVCISNIRLAFYRFLYKDSIKFGVNFRCVNIEFSLNPYDSKIIFGDDVQIRKNAVFRTGRNARVIIGKGSFFNQNFSLNALCGITIGDNSIFGEDVKIYDHNHGYKSKGTLIQDQEYSMAQVFIGNNCWIGSNVVILKGVRIGDNCVIGTNSVIFKDIPPNSLVKSETKLVINPF